MKIIDRPRDKTGYQAVDEAIFNSDNIVDGCYLIQMILGYSDIPDHQIIKEGKDITVALIIENGNFKWSEEWWEAQDKFIILAVANVHDIDITAFFPFE